MGGAALGARVTLPGDAVGAGAGPASPNDAVATRQVGILGGTFDPIHLGHLALARAAQAALGLDEIVFVPAGLPPHKLGSRITPADDRLAMVELAVEGEPRWSVSRIEIDRPGPSYTIDTVESLLGEAAAAGQPLELTVILSVESFADLPTWHDPARLLGLARVAVAPRAGHPAPTADWLRERLPGLEGRIVVLDGPQLEISASDIRARVAAGRSITRLVPPPVAEYIKAHHLYQQPLVEEGTIVTEPVEPTIEPPSSAGPRADGLPSRPAVAPSERPPLEVARRIVELAEDKKAADIVLLDLAGLTTLADAFVICSGGSERQLDAIADGIIEGMRAEKIRPIGREGTAVSHWVLVDFGSVVVHIFTPPERDYYSLEKHWSEAKTVLRVQ
jgi:nicotinate-nucleotide adenylyltransferase